MPTSIVLDSTAIAALFFKDPYSERVDGALERYDRFHTLDLAYAEVGNVAWKRVHIFGEDYAIASKALKGAVDFIEDVCQVVESREIMANALELAVHQRITIYDSLFLSLARRVNAKLLTTDQGLHSRAEASAELKGLTLMP